LLLLLLFHSPFMCDVLITPPRMFRKTTKQQDVRCCSTCPAWPFWIKPGEREGGGPEDVLSGPPRRKFFSRLECTWLRFLVAMDPGPWPSVAVVGTVATEWRLAGEQDRSPSGPVAIKLVVVPLYQTDGMTYGKVLACFRSWWRTWLGIYPCIG
jgi:hypothetical protein